MKSFFTALLLLSLLLTACARPNQEPPLLLHDVIIGEDITWRGKIVIDGKVEVLRGATLTIAPGTDIAFKYKDLDRDGDKDLPLKIRLDRANLPLDLQEVCMTGLISFDPFQSCVEVELLENTNESRKRGRGCRPRGASK